MHSGFVLVLGDRIKPHRMNQNTKSTDSQ
uniref:Uncharacterized protein n=1 Tax=Anguilla anguilla TaxID=7936 RepID=A0A0E9TNU0_ANGAN